MSNVRLTDDPPSERTPDTDPGPLPDGGAWPALTPSEYGQRCRQLMLDTQAIAEYLLSEGVPVAAIRELLDGLTTAGVTRSVRL